MSEKRRKFSRPFGNRPYRKLFVIAVEGEKTEPLYFSLFHGSNSIIQVRCLKGGSNSSPLHVLDRMKRPLREVGLRTTDEPKFRDSWAP